MATRTDVNKTTAIVLGAVFVLVGLWGFVQDPVLGLFEVSLLHNLVHLLSGIVLLAAAFAAAGLYARQTLLTLGVVYLIVTVLGFVAFDLTNTLLGATQTEPATNMADNFLHLLLAVVLIGVPLAFRREAGVTRPGVRV